MARLQILEYPDPRLRTKAKPVDVFDGHLPAGGRHAGDHVCGPGVGFAATQVDVHKRLIVMDVSEGKANPQVFCNPEILTREGVGITEEGCLSVPGIFDEVKRAATIRARAQDVKGKVFEVDLDGLAAVCLQHEMDHSRESCSSTISPISSANASARSSKKIAKSAPARLVKPLPRARTDPATIHPKPSGAPMTSLRIAFAGTPQFALPALRALLSVRASGRRRAEPAGSPRGARTASARVAGQTTRAAEHRLPSRSLHAEDSRGARRARAVGPECSWWSPMDSSFRKRRWTCPAWDA